MDAEFWIATVVVCLVPGTGVVIALTAGLTHGARGAVAGATGGTLSLLPHVVLAASGVAVVLQRSPTAFRTLSLAGAAYLVWMAVSVWRSGPLVTGDDPPVSGLALVRSAVAVNVLNPKVTLFFLAFLPQFVHLDRALSPTAQTLLLSGGFAAVTFVVLLGYGLAAAAGRSALLTRPGLMRGVGRGLAVCLGGLGIGLALGL